MTVGQVCGWEDKQTAESRMVRFEHPSPSML
jgi:hypothetical protein